MPDGAPCELLAAAATADEAFRDAIKEMLLPAIEATLTGEQRAVDEAAVAVAARVLEVMAAHVPTLTDIYDRLEPLVPPDVAPHVVAVRQYVARLAEGLVAAGTSFDAMTAALDAPDGGAGTADSVLKKYRAAHCA